MFSLLEAIQQGDIAMETVIQSERGVGFGLRTALQRLSFAANRGLANVLCWLAVARQRRHLMKLDDRLLKDVGISRADAEREAARKFWDLPEQD